MPDRHRHNANANGNAAFTLIELLIVIAIIAILALIAVPNFLEAQTRSKVARTQADVRTQAMAEEAYCVDWGVYTRDSDSSLDGKDVGVDVAYNPAHPDFGKCANGALTLTTPVPYMTSLLKDPFAVEVRLEGAGGIGYRIASGTWSYDDPPINTKDNQGSSLVFKQMKGRGCFAIIGVGPDQNRARMAYKSFPFHPAADSAEGVSGPSVAMHPSKAQPMCWTEYDPTNGTISVGDIYRFGGDWRAGRFMLNGGIVGSESPIGGSTW